MSEKPQKPEPNDTPEDATLADSPEKSKPKDDLQNRVAKWVLNYKVIAVLIVLTVVINATGLAFHAVGGGGKTLGNDEHDLGAYHFFG